MNKKISLIIISILVLSCFVGLMPVNGELVYLSSNSSSYSSGYGQPWDNTYPNASQTFQALTTAYLDTATLTIQTVDWGSGNHAKAYFRAGIYAVDGESKPNTASGLIELSSSVFLITASADNAYMSMTFSFSKTNQLTSGTSYAFVVSTVYVDFTLNQHYFHWAVSTGGITGSQFYLNGATWYAANPSGYDASSFWVFGQTSLGPTPTPTPAPTSFTATVTSTEAEAYISIEDTQTSAEANGYEGSYTIPIDDGDLCIFYAIPPNTTNLVFAYWSRGAINYTQNPLYIYLSGNITYTAYFTTPGATPTPAPTPNYMDTILNTFITTNNILLIFGLGIFFLCAILGAKFAGAWGFLAGLTVAAILCLTFGVVGLWAVVLIGILDTVAVVNGIESRKNKGT